MGMYDEDGAFFHVVSINQESAHDSLRKHLEATYGYDPEEGLDLYMEFKDEHEIKEGVII
jgi:hypothetical protein